MPPSKLYRYVPFVTDEARDHARQTIVDSLLFFTSPTAFNDPFESRFRIKADGSIEQWRSFATAHLQEAGNPLEALKLTDHFIRGKIPEWQALAESFPDDFRHSPRTSCAVCCFSELFGDLLMWSHYAGGHKGLCLEFSAASADSMFARAEAVTYTPPAMHEETEHSLQRNSPRSFAAARWPTAAANWSTNLSRTTPCSGGILC